MTQKPSSPVAEDYISTDPRALSPPLPSNSIDSSILVIDHDGSNNDSPLLPKRTLDLGPRTSIGLNTSNLREAYLMVHSSGSDVLEARSRNEYDDTERVLKKCDSRTIFSV